MRDPRIGVDLVDVRSFRRRFEGRDDMLRVVFSDAELTYCRSHADPWPHLAARYAAKEALLKALGVGMASAISVREVEVILDEAGAPRLVVRGTAATIDRVAVSLSHTDRQAIAVVLLTGA